MFLQAGFTKESIEDVMNAIPKNEEDDDEEDEKVDVVKERRKMKKQKYHESKYKSKEWILKKKVDKENKEKMLDLIQNILEGKDLGMHFRI